MGFFKGVKDVANLTKEHGGMPSIGGAFRDLGALADDRGEREIIKNGIPVKGIVQGFAEPVQNDKFAMQVPIEVHPPTGAPYVVQYVFPVTRMQAAISVGMEIPVKVHPDDPQRIAVQWDAQKAGIAAAGGDMAAVTAGLNNAYAGTADAAMRQAQANAAAEDPAAKLKKLEQMKGSGLITEEEFAAKRAAIVDAL